MIKSFLANWQINDPAIFFLACLSVKCCIIRQLKCAVIQLLIQYLDTQTLCSVAVPEMLAANEQVLFITERVCLWWLWVLDVCDSSSSESQGWLCHLILRGLKHEMINICQIMCWTAALQPESVQEVKSWSIYSPMSTLFVCSYLVFIIIII